MSCMLTDPYWFYVFCQRDSSEAGPGRAKGVQGRDRWLPGTLAKGLSRDNEPKKLQCLKGNHNNNREERAERRLSGIVVCVSFVLPQWPRARSQAGVGAAEGLLLKADAALSARCLSSRIMLWWAPLEQLEPRGALGEAGQPSERNGSLPPSSPARSSTGPGSKGGSQACRGPRP